MLVCRKTGKSEKEWSSFYKDSKRDEGDGIWVDVVAVLSESKEYNIETWKDKG